LKRGIEIALNLLILSQNHAKQQRCEFKGYFLEIILFEVKLKNMLI